MIFVCFFHTSIIEQLKVNLKNQEALILQKGHTDQETDAPSAKQLADLIAEKDQELRVGLCIEFLTFEPKLQ